MRSGSAPVPVAFGGGSLRHRHPDGLACKLPQDSPIGVRGARKLPVPGSARRSGRPPSDLRVAHRSNRWPCASSTTGPCPFDPNLVSQGIPPDDQVTLNDNIYGPLQGTPRPPGRLRPRRWPRPRSGSTRGCAASACPAVGSGPGAARPGRYGGPSAYTTGAGRAVGGSRHPMTPLATGQYATPDGNVFRQTDLVTQNGQRSWKDLLPTT